MDNIGELEALVAPEGGESKVRGVEGLRWGTSSVCVSWGC